MRRIGLVLLCGLATSCSTARFVSVDSVATDSRFVPNGSVTANDGAWANSHASTLPSENRVLDQGPPGGAIEENKSQSVYPTLLVITAAAVAIYTAVVTFTQMTR